MTLIAGFLTTKVGVMAVLSPPGAGRSGGDRGAAINALMFVISIFLRDVITGLSFVGGFCLLDLSVREWLISFSVFMADCIHWRRRIRINIGFEVFFLGMSYFPILLLYLNFLSTNIGFRRCSYRLSFFSHISFMLYSSSLPCKNYNQLGSRVNVNYYIIKVITSLHHYTLKWHYWAFFINKLTV